MVEDEHREEPPSDKQDRWQQERIEHLRERAKKDREKKNEILKERQKSERILSLLLISSALFGGTILSRFEYLKPNGEFYRVSLRDGFRSGCSDCNRKTTS